jgi:hypothetical protein
MDDVEKASLIRDDYQSLGVVSVQSLPTSAPNPLANIIPIYHVVQWDTYVNGFSSSDALYTLRSKLVLHEQALHIRGLTRFCRNYLYLATEKGGDPNYAELAYQIRVEWM